MQEKIGIISQDVLKAASTLGEGVAGQGETCGALIGAIMAICSVIGRERLEDLEQYEKAMKTSALVWGLFKEKIGHTLCTKIQNLRYEKSYCLSIPEERQAFQDTEGCSRKGCPEICGIAAQIAAAVILDIRGNP